MCNIHQLPVLELGKEGNGSSRSCLFRWLWRPSSSQRIFSFVYIHRIAPSDPQIFRLAAASLYRQKRLLKDTHQWISTKVRDYPYSPPFRRRDLASRAKTQHVDAIFSVSPTLNKVLQSPRNLDLPVNHCVKTLCRPVPAQISEREIRRCLTCHCLSTPSRPPHPARKARACLKISFF